MRLLRRLKESLGGGTTPQRPAIGIDGRGDGKSPVEALFQDAVTRHSKGDLDGAEQSYRQILDRAPDFVPGLHLLGRIHAQRGLLRDAEACVQRAHGLAPDDADILNDLAELRSLAGSPDEAERLLQRALELEPTRAQTHYALAKLHLERADLENARTHLERTVDLDGAHAEALNDLGAAYLQTGRYDEARKTLERAAQLSPSSPTPCRNLSTLYTRLGERRRAVDFYRKALERAPQDQELRMRLADELLLIGDVAAAAREYEAVTVRDPGNAVAWERYAQTASKLGQRKDAIAGYRRALDANPRHPGLLNDLGILLSADGRYEEAAEALEQALRIEPSFNQGLHNLGGAYHSQGRYDDAVAVYQRALNNDPLNTLTISNFIAISRYRGASEATNVEKLHAGFRRSLAPERLRAKLRKFGNAAAARPLRVGYVSPDFRLHSVAFFIEPLIELHDRSRFEVFCYSDAANPDSISERLKSFADHWRDVSAESDEALARRIREDQIDLLVDLDGHFANNRLPVFAQKPAPVQLTYLGYPATTGLPEMDYRVTDDVADPPGTTEGEYTEQLVRLRDGFLCYRPPQNGPAIERKHDAGATVTFGSFNELPKISPQVIRCWCRILEQNPGARLVLKASALGDAATRARVVKRFESEGAASDRIELLGRTEGLNEHLALYDRVDVALDTFPYNGTTTTCEALYMGVPVLTLAGGSHAGRVGVSLLTTLALTDLVAPSEEDYVCKATALAADTQRREIYRKTLRSRMLASPLCDAHVFVKTIESSYLRCWCRRHDASKQNHELSSSTLEVEGSFGIELEAGGRMVLPDSLEQLTAYVLLEQEEWFEAETTFVRKLLTPGMRVLDVGANYGVYTLLAAANVGARGKVFSLEPSATTARWLRANVALNGFEDNVDIFQQALSDQDGELRLVTGAGSEHNQLADNFGAHSRGELVKVAQLDEWAHRCRVESIDFVKLDAEGAEKQIIDGGRRFFDQESPLVMFEIKSGQEFDLDLPLKFSRLGYHLLRVIPGLELLASVDLSQPLDPYTLNLFACKDDRLETLVQSGLVVKDVVRPTTGRDLGDHGVWEYLSALPFARSRVDEWKSGIGAGRAESADRWMRMLGHYVASGDAASDPSSRLASLEAALELVAASDAAIPSAARLQTLARITWALGQRARAVDALSELRDLGDALERTFEWPFIPSSPHFDVIDPGDQLSEWSLACAYDQFERLRSFSSYFNGSGSKELLERLKGNPFERPEMERRRLLVQSRLGSPPDDPSPAVTERSMDNHNPDFWLRLRERV